MLKLKIYGAKIVKSSCKERMQSWEQVVGIVSHLTECLPSVFISFPCSTRWTSYRALIGNLHENQPWQILGHVLCETRWRFINIQYSFLQPSFSSYARLNFPTHSLTLALGRRKKGLRFLWFMKERDFLDVFLRPVFEF